jgi:hypothetical protein
METAVVFPPIILFYLGWSNQSKIEKLKVKHGITWLHYVISYHKFSNLGEKFNCDVTSKVMMGIFDEEMYDRHCGCDTKTKLLLEDDGCICMYDSQFRRGTLVYNLECKILLDEIQKSGGRAGAPLTHASSTKKDEYVSLLLGEQDQQQPHTTKSVGERQSLK